MAESTDRLFINVYVSGNTQARNQSMLLMNHADSAAYCLVRVVKIAWFVIKKVQAGKTSTFGYCSATKKDVEQGAFTGTINSDQTMNFAWSKIETYSIKNKVLTEFFRYSSEF
jgi:hypothetical protein